MRARSGRLCRVVIPLMAASTGGVCSCWHQIGEAVKRAFGCKWQRWHSVETLARTCLLSKAEWWGLLRGDWVKRGGGSDACVYRDRAKPSRWASQSPAVSSRCLPCTFREVPASMIPLFGRTQYRRGAVVLTLKHTFLSVGLESLRFVVTTSENGPENRRQKETLHFQVFMSKVLQLVFFKG